MAALPPGPSNLAGFGSAYTLGHERNPADNGARMFGRPVNRPDLLARVSSMYSAMDGAASNTLNQYG